MAYTIEFKPAAAREIRSLDRTVARRILAKLDALKDDPRPDGVTKLQGDQDLYRIRVGDYRIVYSIEDDELLVLVARVRHRSSAYR